MTDRMSRSDATRARILAAARIAFAQDGYDGATIRGVAQRAGTDPALVIRYFASKDGLFAAATEFDLRLPDLPPEEAGRGLVRHFLSRWEGAPDDWALRIVLRAGMTNAIAAERARLLFADQVLPVITRIVPDQPATRAGLVGTHLIGIAVCRFFLQIPPVAAMPAEVVVAHVGPVVQHYLTGRLAGDFTP